MAEHLVVREATSADVGLLAAMGERTFVAAFGAANTAEDMATYMGATYGAEHQAAELADPGVQLLVVELAGEPVGYAKLIVGSRGSGVVAKRPLEIQRIYTDLPYIGRGIGGFLMAEILRRAAARGHDVVWLAVWEHNPGARRFYQRWGFRLVGEQDFVLGRDVQHDQVMARVVEGAGG
jgi:GNAT superfamily N-acetyltransferase